MRYCDPSSPFTDQKIRAQRGAVVFPVTYVCTCMLSCFSFVQLCDPMDCSTSGSSIHGVLQARIMEWVALLRASQVALVVKNPPVSARDDADAGSGPGSGSSPGEGHGNPLHSCWRIPWTEEPCGLQSIGSQSGTQRKRRSTQLVLQQELGLEFRSQFSKLVI